MDDLSVAKRVELFLRRRHPVSFTAQQIANAIGVRVDTVRPALTRLAYIGVASRDGSTWPTSWSFRR